MPTSCPACHDPRIVTPVPAGELRYALCAGCGSLYLDRWAAGEVLPARSIKPSPGPSVGAIAGLLRRHGLPPGARIAANGLVEPLEAAGFRCDELAVEAAHPASYHALVLCHLVEGFGAPEPLLERAIALLRPEGLLVLTTVNADFARFAIALRERNRPPSPETASEVLQPPGRRVVYTTTGLRRCVERSGLHVLRMVSTRPETQWSGPGLVAQAAHLGSNLQQIVRPGRVTGPSITCLCRLEGQAVPVAKGITDPQPAM